MSIPKRSLFSLQSRATKRLSRLVANLRLAFTFLASLIACLWWAAPAQAVPAFARQTGQNCIACHVGGFGPQLTPFGRAFKLDGYTLSDGKKHIPLSAMLVASYTHTATDQNPPPAGFSANNNFTALQQASVFLAGRITDHLGMLGQATYSDPGSQNLAWDNTELRYAHAYSLGSVSGLFGMSLNNNPTLSDVWNTTPAWQFSYMAPPFGNSGPPVSPLIYSLGQSVVGATAYTMINNSWYVEAGAYHNLSTYWANALHASNASLQGEAPYWRMWYSKTIGPHVFEAGLLGFDARLNNGLPGLPTDHYHDIGLDATYQFLNGGPNIVTANAIYMHERQDLNQTFLQGGASNPSNTLNTANINLSYWRNNTYGATLGLFSTTGSSDAAVYGNGYSSRTNSPNTSGAIFEVDWNPFGKSWTNPEKNLRIGLQYTMYNKYLGARTNFDGAGTNASDLNTLYLYLWTAI
ncbi:MAG: cytochrome c1 protein [Thiomonas sp.]